MDDDRGVRVLEPDGGETTRYAVDRRFRQLELHRRHRLDLCLRPRLKRGLFLGCRSWIELPARGRIDAVAATHTLTRAVGQPMAGKVHVAVRQPWRWSARWHHFDCVLGRPVLGGLSAATLPVDDDQMRANERDRRAAQYAGMNACAHID